MDSMLNTHLVLAVVLSSSLIACSRESSPLASVASAGDEASPLSVVSQSASDVVVLMTADAAEVRDSVLASETYSEVRIAGFKSAAKPGWPAMPSLKTLLAVPNGATVH